MIMIVFGFLYKKIIIAETAQTKNTFTLLCLETTVNGPNH